MDEKDLFEWACRIYIANLRAGQTISDRDLIERTPDVLPSLYDGVRSAWLHRNELRELLSEVPPSGGSAPN